MKNIDLSYNIDAHNKYAKIYHKKHTEIFNIIEQDRLSDSLENAIATIGKSPETIEAMDYGCGSGNLTHHLLGFGLNVTSADISTEFLKIIKETYSVNSKSKTFLLNGRDLSEVQNDSFDMVCLYSVLHHIPDYLSSLNEIVRVTKAGGIIYIDHDLNPNYWLDNKELNNFRNEIPKKTNFLYCLNIFNPKWYIKKYNKIRNPRWQAEGDIHVWYDDHIQWDEIDNLMNSSNMDRIYLKDYLSYSSSYPEYIYNKYKDKCSDMRCAIYKKTN
jgi:SAM-dependent methyltransferase